MVNGTNGEAEEMDRQTLEAKTRVIGREHPDTLGAECNLEWVLQVQRR